MKKLLLSLMLLTLLSCNNDSSSPTSSSPTDDSTPPPNDGFVHVKGVVSAGPIDGASVYLYKLNSDGTFNESLGTTTTDSAGNFSFTVAPQTNPVEFGATGGTYNEEASGLPISFGDIFRTKLPSLPEGTIKVGITPLTEVASACANAIQIYTAAPYIVNVTNCNKAMSLASGLTDITTSPANPNITLANPNSQASKYALLLAGISQFANQNNFDSSLVVANALKTDFYLDGKFDGKNNGVPVIFDDVSSTPMNTHMWSNELAFSVNYFRNSSTIFSNTLVPIFIANPSLTCSTEAPTKCGALCVNTSASKYHCGACGAVCALANASTQSCVSGTCAVGTCNSGYGNCDQTAANGCEVNLNSDLVNCGACGNVCSTPSNASAGCSLGVCGIASCNSGYANCDQSAGNGCEVNINSDPTNCGSCGSVCPNTTHGTPTCTSGSCSFSCNAGYTKCGGACNDLNNDIYNCGGCGNTCWVTHGTPSCSSGVCGIAACSAGYANCNGNKLDGCEVYTLSDNNNCGSCGNVCSFGKSCVSGSCQ